MIGVPFIILIPPINHIFLFLNIALLEFLAAPIAIAGDSQTKTPKESERLLDYVNNLLKGFDMSVWLVATSLVQWIDNLLLKKGKLHVYLVFSILESDI